MRKKRNITHKSEYIISIIAINVVFFLFVILNFTFSYQSTKSSNIEKANIISENIHQNFEDQFNQVASFSRNTFLNNDFLFLQDNVNTNQEEIESYFASSLQSSSSIVIGTGYIPKINQELNSDKRIYTGQFDGFFSVNTNIVKSYLTEIINKSYEDEFTNGKIYPVFDVNNDVSNFIIFARNIKDIRQETYNDKLGIGFIAVNKNTFLNPFSLTSTLNGFDASITINDEILFSSNSNLLLNNNYIYKSSLNFNNYYLTTYYDTSTIFKDLFFSFSLELIVYLFIIIAFLAIYHFLHKNNIKSLNYLFNSFDKNKNQIELQLLDYTESDDEVNKVIQSYNQMVQSVNNLNKKINEEKEEANLLKLKNKEFEIENLYSQINKHFIINILSVVHSLINLNDIDKANYCLESLSDYLRYSLSFNIKETSIQNEIESIKNYINLQLIRYQDINVFYDIDENCLSYEIPKLILQPLVENAFVHGLKKKKGNIKISLKLINNIIYLIVQNDGIVDLNILESINENIKNGIEIKTGNHGVALVNINKRLHLMYGNKAKVYLTVIDNKTASIIEINLQEETC